MPSVSIQFVYRSLPVPRVAFERAVQSGFGERVDVLIHSRDRVSIFHRNRVEIIDTESQCTAILRSEHGWRFPLTTGRFDYSLSEHFVNFLPFSLVDVRSCSIRVLEYWFRVRFQLGSMDGRFDVAEECIPHFYEVVAYLLEFPSVSRVSFHDFNVLSYRECISMILTFFLQSS